MSLRLITIPISHYCERARWALDLAGVPYREEHHLPPFQARASRKAGGSGSVPILVTETGSLTDSADIVALAAERGAPLYPASADRAEIDALSAELAGKFGVETRRLAYSCLFDAPALLPYMYGHAPRWQRGLIRVTLPVFGGAAKTQLGITPAKVAAGLEFVDRTFDAMDARIADGRRYLTGDDFTAADLTFATMSATVLLPDRFGVPLPELDEIPADFRELALRLRDRPSAQLALRAYDQRPDSPLRDPLR